IRVGPMRAVARAGPDAVGNGRGDREVHIGVVAAGVAVGVVRDDANARLRRVDAGRHRPVVGAQRRLVGGDGGRVSLAAVGGELYVHALDAAGRGDGRIVVGDPLEVVLLSGCKRLAVVRS